jgi:hypothetical protein
VVSKAVAAVVHIWGRFNDRKQETGLFCPHTFSYLMTKAEFSFRYVVILLPHNSDNGRSQEVQFYTLFSSSSCTIWKLNDTSKHLLSKITRTETRMILKMAVFWIVAPCGLAWVYSPPWEPQVIHEGFCLVIFLLKWNSSVQASYTRKCNHSCLLYIDICTLISFSYSLKDQVHKTMRRSIVLSHIEEKITCNGR